MQPELPLQVKT